MPSRKVITNSVPCWDCSFLVIALFTPHRISNLRFGIVVLLSAYIDFGFKSTTQMFFVNTWNTSPHSFNPWCNDFRFDTSSSAHTIGPQTDHVLGSISKLRKFNSRWIVQFLDLFYICANFKNRKL
jgi:hypothetical protein